MQDIIKELVEKAGVTAEQASKSIQVMKDFIQSKLPPGFSAMVDNFFAQQKQEEDILEGKAESVKDKAADMKNSISDKASDVMDDIKETADNAYDKVKDFAKNANETLSTWIKDAEGKGEEAINKLKDMLGGDKKENA